MEGCFIESRMIGVLGARDGNHIALLFVEKIVQKQGAASRMMQVFRKRCKEQGFSEITVNSSPYAFPIYARWGFQPDGPEEAVNGIRFTPMTCRIKQNEKKKDFFLTISFSCLPKT